MRYKSTRGGVKDCSFVEAVLMGLAPDGGLLVPQSIPTVSPATLETWRTLSFPDLAVEVISLYIDESEITRAELATLTKTAYASFRTEDVTPVAPLGDALQLLELFHGPTYAFKDVALQFLGVLFELILKKRGGRLTIVGATSGDTGSSAIAGVRGKAGIDCFILYPENRTSKIQEAQMCAYEDSNVHAIALRGAFFDDCQKIVKGLFADQAFHKKHSLGAVNSINWARIVAQIVYYFYASFRVEGDPCFSVPTGNFGDVLAGWYAKKMGCPCRGLVVATNANDILARFFATGTYSRPASAVETCAPSMDISISSNFERFVFHCGDDDTVGLKALMDTFEKTGAFTAPAAVWAKAKAEMHASSVQHDSIIATIKKWHGAKGYVLDPHTAIGVAAATDLATKLGDGPIVCLACAHHAKFPTAVEEAIGVDALAKVPEEKALTALLKGPLRKTTLDNSEAVVIDFIESTMLGRADEPATKKAKA
jgi:threonine synthase